MSADYVTDYQDEQRKEWVERIIAECVNEGTLSADEARDMTDGEKDRFAEHITGSDYPESEPF